MKRVGKTTLINEFCTDKKTIYYVGTQSTIYFERESVSIIF